MTSTSSATHTTLGKWATESLAPRRRRGNKPCGGAHGSTLYSPLGPGGLGFPAAPPVLHCPARDRSRGTNESSAGGPWPHPSAGRETEAPKQEGTVGDTPEDSRLQGLQAQCNGTQSLSWEDP